MNNSKVINILRKFSNKEFVRFREYLSSPYFNKNIILVNILDALSDFNDDYDNRKLTYEFIMSKVYLKQDRKIEKLRNDLSQLFKQAKNFLTIQEFQTADYLKSYKLIKSLRNKDLGLVFEKESNRFKQNLSREIDEHNQFFQYLFYDEQDAYFLEKNTRKYDDNLQLKMDALDGFYLTTKLKEACEMLNRNAIYQKGYQIRLSNLLDRDLPLENLDRYNQSIKFYLKTYEMLKSNEREDFVGLLDLLDKFSHELSADKIRELYIHAQNFCTRNINSGNKEYFQDMFQIFQKLIQNNLLLIDGYLPHSTYKNIVSVALNVGENDWVLQFIETYKDQLKDGVQASAYQYNLAKYNYSVGKIKEAVQLLQTVNYEDNYFQIDARYLLLKILYETNEHDSLLYYIDAFKLYLKRNKNFNIVTRELVITFLKLLRKTAMLKNRQAYLSNEDYKNRLAKLNAQFEANKNIPYKRWMEEILEKLTNRVK